MHPCSAYNASGSLGHVPLWPPAAARDLAAIACCCVPRSVRVGEGLVGRCGLDDSKPVNVTEYQGNDHLISTVLAPVLEGRAVRSLLVQPIFRNDNSGKVTAVILAVNKKDNGSETDIFFEDYFTEVGAEGGMA